jgi:hypothetical protein
MSIRAGLVPTSLYCVGCFAGDWPGLSVTAASGALNTLSPISCA